MKKFLFLGAFALFAMTASAQSTQAPAEKKAKTEQTCSKDANKATCSKGASASTDAKGATCSKDKAAGCCSAKAAAEEPKKNKKAGKKGNKTSGLSGGK